MRTAFRTLAIASVVAASTVLAGCATTTQSWGSLAETKSPTQLLRNQTASYFTDLAEADPVVVDESVACHPAADDPDGLVRRWVSSVDLTVLPSVTGSMDEFVGRAVDPLLDKGWTVAYEAALEVGLTKQRLPSSIRLTPTLGPDGAAAGGHLVIAALGPCVDTGGADSDEVTDLERIAND